MSFLGTTTTGNQNQSQNLLNYNAESATPQMGNATAAGNNALQTGMGYLNQFSNTLNAPSNYFQSLLSGNKAVTTAALAPDTSRINDTIAGATNSTGTLTPRGGGRSSTLFNLPFQGQAQESGLFNQLRPQAAQGLTGIAGLQGNVGLGESAIGNSLLNTGANFLNAGTSAANALGGQASQSRAQNLAQANAVGQGLYGLATGGASNILSGVQGLGSQIGGIFGGGASLGAGLSLSDMIGLGMI